MLTLIVLLALVYLGGLALASLGVLGERARHYVSELNEEGQRQRVEQHLREADRANAKAHRQARSAMNQAVGQQWRDMSEWRDE